MQTEVQESVTGKLNVLGERGFPNLWCWARRNEGGRSSFWLSVATVVKGLGSMTEKGYLVKVRA